MSSVFRRPWLLRYCQSIVCARVPQDSLQYPGVVHAQIRKVDVPSRRLLISDTHACIWAKLTEECMNELSRFRTNLVELVGGIIQLNGFELKISVPDLDATGQGTWAELMKAKASASSQSIDQQEEIELILNVWAMDYNGGDEIEVQGDPLICTRDHEIVIALQETPLGELQNRIRTRQQESVPPPATVTTTTTITSGETPGKWKPSWDLDSFCAIAEETRQAERSRLIEVHSSEPGSELQDVHQSPGNAKAVAESLTGTSPNNRVYHNASTESSSGRAQAEDSSSQDEPGYFVTGEVEVKPRGGQSSTPPITKHVSFAIRTPLQARLKDPRDLSEQEILQNPKLGKFIKRKSDFSPAVRVTPSKKIPSESPLGGVNASSSNNASNLVHTPQATVALVETATSRSPSKNKVFVGAENGQSTPAKTSSTTTTTTTITTTSDVSSSDVIDGKARIANTSSASISSTAATEEGISKLSSSLSERGTTPSPPDQVPLQEQFTPTTKNVYGVKKSTNLDVLASAVLEEEAKRSFSPVKVESSSSSSSSSRNTSTVLQPTTLLAVAGSPSGLEQDEAFVEQEANNISLNIPPQAMMTSFGTDPSAINQASDDQQHESQRRRQSTTTTGSEANDEDDEMADTVSEQSSEEEEEKETIQKQRQQQEKRSTTGAVAFAIVGKKVQPQQRVEGQQRRKGKQSNDKLGPLTQKGDDHDTSEEDVDESEEEETESDNAKAMRGSRTNIRNGSQQEKSTTSTSTSEPSTRMDGPLTQMPVDEASEKQQPPSAVIREVGEAEDKKGKKQIPQQKKGKDRVVPVRRSKRLQLGPLTQAGAVEEEDEDEETLVANTEQQQLQSQQSSEKPEDQEANNEESVQQSESQSNPHPFKKSNEDEQDESPLVSSMDIESMNGVIGARAAIRGAPTTTTTANASPSRTRKSTSNTTRSKSDGHRSSSSTFKLKKTVFTSLPRISVNTKLHVNWVAEGGPGFMQGMEQGDQIVSVQGKKELKEIRLALENGPIPLEVVWRSLHANSDEKEEDDMSSSSISEAKEDDQASEHEHDHRHSQSGRSRIAIVSPHSATAYGTHRHRRFEEDDDLVGKRYEHFWGGMVYYGEVVVRTNKDEYLLRDVDGAEQIVDRVQAQRLVSGELSVPHEHIRDPDTRKTKCVTPQQQQQQQQQQPRSFKLVVPPSTSSSQAKKPSSSSKSKSPEATISNNTRATGRSEQQQATKRVKLMRKKLTTIDETSEAEAETISWTDFKRMLQKGVAGQRQQ